MSTDLLSSTMLSKKLLENLYKVVSHVELFTMVKENILERDCEDPYMLPKHLRVISHSANEATTMRIVGEFAGEEAESKSSNLCKFAPFKVTTDVWWSESKKVYYCSFGRSTKDCSITKDYMNKKTILWFDEDASIFVFFHFRERDGWRSSIKYLKPYLAEMGNSDDPHSYAIELIAEFNNIKNEKIIQEL